MTPQNGISRRPGTIALAAILCAQVLAGHVPAIGLTRNYFSFSATQGGPNPPAQYLIVGNSTHGRMPWSATVSTDKGGNWLVVSPSSGVLPGVTDLETVILTVSVISASLPAGVFSATITISAPGDASSPPASNTPQTVDVTLTVGSGQPPPMIRLSATTLTLDAVAGSAGGPSAIVQLSNAGAQTLTWTAAPDTSGGGNWLSVTPTSGVNTSVLTITARAAALSRGTYAGRIMITAPAAANSPQAISVTFRVSDPAPPVLRLSQTSLSFAAVTQTESPPPKSVEIDNAGQGALSWRAAVSTFNGGLWLTASPESGVGPGVVTVSAQSQGLPAGAYAGEITVTAVGATNSPARVPVTLTVRRQQPAFDLSGVVNGATFLPSSLAPGQIATLFGSRLGPQNGVAFTLDPLTRRLPETLAGTRITLDGISAPLFYVSHSQVNFQVPFEVAGKATARMVVSVDGLDPAESSVSIREAAPGIFTVDGTRAAALNQNFTLNIPENPAAPGSVIQMFLTGQGLVGTKIETGALAPTEPPFPAPNLPVTATMNEMDARVLFAGLAPGFAGLLQVNVEVPPGVAPSNQVNVAVRVGPYPAGRGVTIAVR